MLAIHSLECTLQLLTLRSAGARRRVSLVSIDIPLLTEWGVAIWRRSLSDFYRARYPLACWISIAVLIQSLNQSLSISLISYRGNRDLEIAPTVGDRFYG